MWSGPGKFESSVAHPGGTVLRAERAVGLELGGKIWAESGAWQAATCCRDSQERGGAGRWEGSEQSPKGPPTLCTPRWYLAILLSTDCQTQPQRLTHTHSHLQPGGMKEGVHRSLRPRRRNQENMMLEKRRGTGFKNEGAG